MCSWLWYWSSNWCFISITSIWSIQHYSDIIRICIIIIYDKRIDIEKQYISCDFTIPNSFICRQHIIIYFHRFNPCYIFFSRPFYFFWRPNLISSWLTFCLNAYISSPTFQSQFVRPFYTETDKQFLLSILYHSYVNKIEITSVLIAQKCI